ncbi:MAG: hypothetical protein IT288_06790 [Bdellovibrionales bacterium]|nr:hypothetical protein [Bdellovibrionales bacterium]
MKRNLIHLMLGFLVGFGILLGVARASTFPPNFPPIKSTLTQEERDYLAGRPWLLQIFEDLPPGIELRFRTHGLTGQPLFSIDFVLGTQYSADIKRACQERIDRIAEKLRSEGRQVLSGTCIDIVNSLEPGQKKIKGQVIYLHNDLSI